MDRKGFSTAAMAAAGIAAASGFGSVGASLALAAMASGCVWAWIDRRTEQRRFLDRADWTLCLSLGLLAAGYVNAWNGLGRPFLMLAASVAACSQAYALAGLHIRERKGA